MRSMALAIALTLTIGVGCAAESEESSARVVDVGVRAAPTIAGRPARTWRIVLDPSVSSSEEVVVRRALLAWERVIPCAVDFVVERRRVSGIDELLPPPFVAEIRMGVPPAGVGWADWDPLGRFGARIILLPNATDSDRADFPRVVEHEIGHAFHLEHTPSGLMAERSPPGTRVSPLDGSAFAARWCPSI